MVSLRADSLPLGERRKFIGKVKVCAGPYFCPMCGSLGEDIFHLVGRCVELKDLRMFGQERLEEEDLVKIMGKKNFGDLRRLGRFLKQAMEHRERFLE